ncbi:MULTISPECIES: hypothetical protein [unclassified Bradyrhizobium]|uniref:hypothetical protein n=1 Tax=unclassified Bradyrhizobium TaxID=2631580 RepID=UPI002916305D|nr:MULTISPECIES: hypothetical protein [unclassified Bradyrhizobium]
MTINPRVGAVLIHPNGDVNGNILWPGVLPVEHRAALPAAIATITTRGYWANPFPEGDGVTFKRERDKSYDPDVSLADFRAAFDFLDLDPLDPAEGQARALARLAAGRIIACTCLLPVEGLRLKAPFTLGQTRFHAPVDGKDIPLANHAWQWLCDEQGADVDPSWVPGARATGTTELLGHPLIERKMEVPLSELYECLASYDCQSALLRRVMEEADHTLDPIRFDLCGYRRLEYLPAKPGWIGETALAYVIPEGDGLPPRFLQGKPYVLRVSNNWLGLELDKVGLRWADALAAMVVDDTSGNETKLALKAALRAFNRAFYLVELEASFLHLIYAIDALCDPGKLTGERHRLWIATFGSGGDETRFAGLLGDFDYHYRVRNRIVHEGETFASLGLIGEDQCQFMLRVLRSCILTFVREGFSTPRDAAQFAFDVLTSPGVTAHLTTVAWKNLRLPLTADRGFAQHMQI